MNNFKNLKKLKVSNHTLKRYRDLDYEVWYALSEFIDNSIHSYLENKEELNEDQTKFLGNWKKTKKTTISQDGIKVPVTEVDAIDWLA